MIGKPIDTAHGTIHYWIDPAGACKEPQLVFLPGLTADHRLFDRQIECFEGRYPGQMYSQLYPEKLQGFISIDSAPERLLYRR